MKVIRVHGVSKSFGKLCAGSDLSSRDDPAKPNDAFLLLEEVREGVKSCDHSHGTLWDAMA
jgi:hypothetical protein